MHLYSFIDWRKNNYEILGALKIESVKVVLKYPRIISKKMLTAG